MALPIVHHPLFRIQTARHRRFPGGKLNRMVEILEAERLAGPGGFHVPRPVDREGLALVHHGAYVDQVLACEVPKPIEREIGFPIHEELVLRSRYAAGGTLLAARLALRHGIACNTAGGGHHARYSQGAGFCVFNDVGIAIGALLSTGEIERALVIDCDVHQGDGTADLFASEPAVYTFSIHAQKNYPVRKRASDRDIGLPDNTGDAAYLEVLQAVLPEIVERHRPDIVFFNAGVDPHHEDELGRLKLSDNGLRERERVVIGTMRERLVPVACVVGGGYSQDVEALALRHAGLYRVAAEFV